MRLSSKTLADIVTMAAKSGTVFSIKPGIENRKGMLEVLLTKDGKVTEMAYDLDGKPIAHTDKDDDKD
jgi:hypothetical protein